MTVDAVRRAVTIEADGPLAYSKEETLARLPYAQLVPQIHRAALEVRSGTIQAPPRLTVPMDGKDGALMCMPATAGDIATVKLLTVLPDNAAKGLPMVQGQVSVFDTANGRLLARLDAEAVTSRRTAAVSLAGAERLLGRSPNKVLVIGSGVQAASHIEAFAEYFGTTDFVVAARTRSSAEEMRSRILDGHDSLSIEIIVLADLDDCSWEGMDVVVCATAAQTPVLSCTVPPNVLVIAVGAYRPDMVELSPQLLRGRTVVVDTLDGARHEAGDLISADIDWSAVEELCDVGYDPHRHNHNQVLKTVGHAAWDLAACRTVLGSEFIDLGRAV